MTQSDVSPFGAVDRRTSTDQMTAGDDPFDDVRMGAPTRPPEPVVARTSATENLFTRLGLPTSADLLCSLTAGDTPNPVRTPQAIGQSWEATFQARRTAIANGTPPPSFDQTNQDMQAAVLAAYQRGGADAVHQLMMDVNAAIPSARVGPIIVPNGLNFDVHHGQVLTQQQFEQLRRDNPNRTDLVQVTTTRNNNGRIEPFPVYLQTLAPPHRINTFGEPRQLTREQTQQVIDAADQEIAASRLNDANSRQLLTAMHAVARGDMSALSRMLPHGDQAMSPATQEAFVRAMARLGVNVEIDSGIRGGSDSTMLLVPQGSTEAIRISHTSPTADSHRYTVESINVRPGALWRVIQPGTQTTNPETVTERFQAIRNLMTPPRR